MIDIYNNPVSVDIDQNCIMTVYESVFFALAMSLDGLFGDIGAAFLKINILITVITNFLIGLTLTLAGQYIGNKVSRKWDRDIGWLSGALFIFLALRKII